MGQKVNPHGARVGVIFGWLGRWYAGKRDIKVKSDSFCDKITSIKKIFMPMCCISNVNFYLDRKMNRVRFNF